MKVVRLEKLRNMPRDEIVRLLDLLPNQAKRVAVAFKEKKRRKVKSCTITFVNPNCDCCGPSIEIARNGERKPFAYV
jgi:hypothetical protein